MPKSYIRALHLALQGVEVGPRSEVAYWQSRLTLLSHISDKFRCREFAIVIGVAATARCKIYNEWKTLDGKVCHIKMHAFAFHHDQNANQSRSMLLASIPV